jgi:hypothetical protein
MSDATKVDARVDKHLAQFQQALSLAETMGDRLEKPSPMPYGYPLRVLHPRHVRHPRQAERFARRARGRLSNGIPPILTLRLSDGYLRGPHNPRHPYRDRAGGLLRFRRNDPEGCRARARHVIPHLEGAVVGRGHRRIELVAVSVKR